MRHQNDNNVLINNNLDLHRLLKEKSKMGFYSFRCTFMYWLCR